MSLRKIMVDGGVKAYSCRLSLAGLRGRSATLGLR